MVRQDTIRPKQPRTDRVPTRASSGSSSKVPLFTRTSPPAPRPRPLTAAPSVWTILFFVTYHARSNLQYFASETYCAVAGITFMLIHVRVGLGWEQRAHSSNEVASVDLSTATTLRDSRQHPYGSPRVAVNITRIVQRDDELYEQYEADLNSIKFAPNSVSDATLAGRT